MAKDSSSSPMDPITEAISKMDNLVVKAPSNGLMVVHSKGSGNTTNFPQAQ